MGTEQEGHSTVTNPFFPDPTTESPDRIQGWLAKKVKVQDTKSTEPKKRETKDMYRWFVYDKKEKVLQYYRTPAHAEESAGNNILNISIIHKITLESGSTLLIDTLLHEWPATKNRKFRVTASSAAEARLWEQGLETARMEWLLQATALVMRVQKKFRQRQARKHVEKARKTRRSPWKSNYSFIFATMFFFLAVSMSFFRSNVGMGFARDAMGIDLPEAVVPATDWVLDTTSTSLNKLRPGLGTKVVNLLQDPVITVHIRKPSFNATSFHEFSVLMYGLSVDSFNEAYNAMSSACQATASAGSGAASSMMKATSGWAQNTSVWAGSASMNFSQWVDSVPAQAGRFVGSFMKGPHGYAAEKLRPRMRSDAVIAAGNLRFHYDDFKSEQQDHNGLRFEKTMHTFNPAKGRKSELDPKNYYHMLAKLLSISSGVNVMQCVLSIQTEDKLICPHKDDMGRCKVMQVLLEELEIAVLAEFEAEHAHYLTENKATNEQAGFIILDGWW